MSTFPKEPGISVVALYRFVFTKAIFWCFFIQGSTACKSLLMGIICYIVIETICKKSTIALPKKIAHISTLPVAWRAWPSIVHVRYINFWHGLKAFRTNFHIWCCFLRIQVCFMNWKDKQFKLKQFSVLTQKPRSHVRILIDRTVRRLFLVFTWRQKNWL